jgi:hypothetical protein
MLAHSLPADLSPCKFCNLVSFWMSLKHQCCRFWEVFEASLDDHYGKPMVSAGCRLHCLLLLSTMAWMKLANFNSSTAVEFVKSGVCMWYHHKALGFSVQRLLLPKHQHGTCSPAELCSENFNNSFAVLTWLMDDRLRNFDHTAVYNPKYFERYRKCVKLLAHGNIVVFYIVDIWIWLRFCCRFLANATLWFEAGWICHSVAGRLCMIMLSSIGLVGNHRWLWESVCLCLWMSVPPIIPVLLDPCCSCGVAPRHSFGRWLPFRQFG